MTIAGHDATHGSSSAPHPTWFRTRDGRRYGREIALLVVLKLVLLTLLWVVCIKPAPRVHATPDAVAQHLVAPPPAAAHD